MKKKFVSLVMISFLALILIMGGCAWLQKAGQDVQDFVCDPPANVVALAEAADPFIAVAVAMAVPQALLAYQGVVAILSGGTACATVTQINALIAMLQGEQTKAMARGMKTPRLNPQPLMDWLAKAAPGK